MKNCEDVVLNFIQRRFTIDCNWMNGNCYYFSLILQSRFSNGVIIYDPIDGHFLFRLDNFCYDFKGKHKLPKVYYVWNKLKDEDINEYNRIKRDCIK